MLKEATAKVIYLVSSLPCDEFNELTGSRQEQTSLGFHITRPELKALNFFNCYQLTEWKLELIGV